MLDFNTKKDILKRLRKKGSENVFMRVLCGLAAAFVKLWYGAVCGIGMAFSDKNGNFLGIKPREKAPKKRRQDDIVYVKKPFIGRVLSALLAAAFVLMIAPEAGLPDLGIRASAVVDYNTTVTKKLKVGTTEIELECIKLDTKSASGDEQWILADEYKFAQEESVEHDEYHTADGALYVTWNEYKLSNRLGASSIPTVLHGDIVHTGYTVLLLNHGSPLDSYLKSFDVPNRLFLEISSNDYNLNRDTIYDIVVLPKFKIQKYDNVNVAPPEDTPEYNLQPSMGANSSFDVPIRKNKGANDYTYELQPNATLIPPAFNVGYKDTGNAFRPYDTNPACSYDSVAWLKWFPCNQQGGVEEGEEATGYRVHVSSDGGKTWSRTDYARTDNRLSKDTDGGYLLSVPVTAGLHYQFYVEAYKINWGNTAYDNNNKGMISSGGNPVGNAKDLYIAPKTPTISKVEQNISSDGKPFYEITVTHNGGDKNYSGVYLFRTTNVLLTDDNTPANTYRTFGEWLKENSSEHKDGNPAFNNLRYIPNAFDSANTYKDKDIVEGVTYYYYIVAFQSISNPPNADYILCSDSYDWKGTTFRLNDFRAITPSLPRVTISDDQITVNWDAISGAEKYDIEIIQTGKHDPETNETKDIPADEQKTKVINWNNTTSYPHEGLLYSDRYQYRIRGVVEMETMIPKEDADGNIIKDQNGNIVYEQVTGIYTKWSDPVSATVGTRIGTPTITDVASTDGQLTVKWTAVTGAKGYYLEYENVNTPSITGIITVENATSYVHRNLKNGDVYRYRVCAYKEIDIPGNPQKRQIVKGSPSEWYTPVRVGDELLIPQDLRLTTKDGEITATWKPVQGATGYILYSKKDGTSGDPVEFRVSAPPFTQTGLTNGDVYTYQVRAIKRVNGGDDLSGFSTPASIKVGEELATPQNIKTTTKDGEITISWDAVNSATSYTLHYRNVTKGTSGEFNITNPPFTHTGLNNGDVYEYYVTAYKEVNGKPIDGPKSVTVTQMVGAVLDTPKDFTAATKDGTVVLTWTAVKGAEGYIVYATSGGQYEQFDVSKTTYTHSDLENGTTWSYRVAAYKTVNGTRTYSQPSGTKTVSVGVSLNSAVDLTATAGNRQIDLSWTAVTGAEGYVVYLYNSKTMEFEPITATSKTTYSHVGLKNGKQYTYMVAPYKNINGKRFYGDYSMSVTAIPTTGSITDMDHELTVKGTAPYGISHSEYISAVSNHGAFDESVDVYFSTNRESTQAVKDVLKNYADGLSSFIIYPFDISIYKENTFIKVDPADGYFVTVTMPVPDKLIAYRDYITVIHINENPGSEQDISEITLASDWLRSYDQRLEVLPCAIVDIDNVWCVQFKCTSFSPYALVIYKEHITDIGTGGGVMDGDFAGTFNSGVLLFTALPDIMPNPRRLRIVRGGSKRYRVKNVEKR